MAKSKEIPGTGPVESSQVKLLYLTAYNFASAVLWATVLGRTVGAAYLRGPEYVPIAVSYFVRWTQTLALLEVVHSLLGVVRAPFFTTVMQVASRLLLVWAVVYPFPNATTSSVFYTSMLLAWSTTEVIRYFYFALSLARSASASGSGANPPVPDWFTILRYSTFLVLYPIGISSEVRLVYLAAATPGAAESLHPYYPYALYAVLAVYVPGSYILYTHMLAQRRKVLRRLKADSSKAQ
ncbi:3-hydroxy acyl-CoA dehydratase [Sporothrix schenckii 1099-18]|uniref:Very-long-chain (3R)-3-hydroxyacyl-CoA dehydratase n=1 Tax=Sporothrix schenckii 1099-18 TaxID=1397361 RepID=A0A0F2M7J0_SPOSC|nr:3-hydroxy acyl-CoA dehydratase [Sporothrix schenckii 1099-18]KJR85658.1 3-hydroxy acyl-CoA dehydratase [Sporothrix schenckii 1099-18]